jgi:predicted acylesterase/phospholipase RssA/CRP-like cAMP-binding protein
MNEKNLEEDLIKLVQRCALFSEVDEKGCRRLLAMGKYFELSKNEILFKQGDDAHELYILLEGRLLGTLETADRETKIVGYMEAGESVGELGVFTDEPRTLTITAVTPAKLLKISKEVFTSFFLEYPSVVTELISILVSRSQKSIQLLAGKKPFKEIVLVSTLKGNMKQEFIQHLAKYVPENTRFICGEKYERNVSTREQVLEEIREAKKNATTIVYWMEPGKVAMTEALLENPDEIYLLVDDADSFEEKLSDFVDLEHHHQIPCQLVVLHPDSCTQPENTRRWLGKADFRRVQHIKLSNQADYERLLRFFNGSAFTVVISGGGARGWYVKGATKAIKDANISIDAIGGTSVGAICSAFYAKNGNFEEAIENTFEVYKVIKHLFSFRNLTYPLISVTSGRMLTNTLKKMWGDIHFEDLWIPCFAVSCNLTLAKEDVHQTGLVWQALRSSVSIPGVYPPMVLNDEMHIDGGVINNFPVDVMRRLVTSSDTILGMKLSSAETNKTKYRFPPSISFSEGLFYKLGFLKASYLFPNLFDTFIQSLIVGSAPRENRNRLMVDILLEPDLTEYNMLKINSKQEQELTKLGYDQSKEALIDWKKLHKST